MVLDREHLTDVVFLCARYLTSLEQVKLQELQLAQLQRKIVEGETKLKQQQNLYEAVRSDRNLYSKNLIEAQEEIEEMKRKFKIMNHQIEQLKEEITTKDHSLVKEHFDHHKVEKEKENLKNELTRVQKQIQSSEHVIHNQDGEMQKLAHIIQEADEERQRQQKEYDAVVSERDILGSQLIRRDEELSGLYEKIKIQKSTLAKGAAQYEERRMSAAQLKCVLPAVGCGRAGKLADRCCRRATGNTSRTFATSWACPSSRWLTSVTCAPKYSGWSASCCGSAPRSSA